MNKVDTLVIGSGGFAVSEIATPIMAQADATNIVQVIVQIIIGIATLVGLFKKNKK